MTDINWTEAQEIARVQATQIAKRWPVVEVEDVEQEIVLWAAENINAWQGKTDAVKHGIFKKVATRYASGERTYQDMFTCQYWYTPEEVRAALRSLTEPPESFSHINSDSSPLLAKMDVERALKKIPDRYKKLMFEHIVLGRPFPSPGDKKATYRGVDILTSWINRHSAIETKTSRKGEDLLA
ncbi:hypothetical protein [Streptomyces sp. WZ-12]|uniref:hypothetical protein n=1 Tax=Streptomyces sp. WZ-12 TaxID=3030210 RepID=UPI00238157F3|nr:hypothetical protein [Streptomyces sp. WZ-12]